MTHTQREQKVVEAQRAAVLHREGADCQACLHPYAKCALVSLACSSFFPFLMNLPDGHSHALVCAGRRPLRFTQNVLWTCGPRPQPRSRVVDTRGCFTVRDRVLGACLQQRVDRVACGVTQNGVRSTSRAPLETQVAATQAGACG